MKHYNLKIQGRVWGVNFRWATKQKALGLDICGFVQNIGNRTVYVEAEGQEEELEEFIAWCHRGPLFAKVVELKFEEAPIVGYNNFVVKF